MFSKLMLSISLVAGIFMILITTSAVSSSLCTLAGVTSTYPHEALPNQQIQVSTTIVGSCASDGEDYFSARADLVDKLANSTLSSNSIPIGYNAKNFSVTIQNVAVTPSVNGTWPLEVSVYVTESGGVNGKYLLTINNATIQVGTLPTPEFHVDPNVVVVAILLAAILMIRNRPSKRHRLKMFDRKFNAY